MNNTKEKYKITIDGIEIQEVENVTYLEQIITCDGDKLEEEINKRITLTQNSLEYIFKGPYSKKQKSEIFNICVLPTLLYGSQTWSLTKKQE